MALGRSPHGERGLKFPGLKAMFLAFLSLPTRGAWIEIMDFAKPAVRAAVAPHTGSVD